MFVFIRLAESYAASPEAQLALVTGGIRHELMGGFIEKNLFAVRDTELLLENTALGAAFSDICIHHKTISAEDYVFLENLDFHHSFFINFFDFSKSPDIYLFQGQYTKPEPVAVVAIYKGDRVLLKFWATYYARLVSPKHLYVLDGSDAQDARQILSADINVVRLPRISFDELGFINAANSFQRFLLSNFQWVVQTSCNEILLYKFGITQFFKDLQARTAPAMLLPDRVYALTSEAFAASGEKPVGNLPQMVQLPTSGKPILASTPVTWYPDAGDADAEDPDFAWIQEQHHITTEAYLWLIRFVRDKPNEYSMVSDRAPFEERQVKEA
jgi:hypothetical protein